MQDAPYAVFALRLSTGTLKKPHRIHAQSLGVRFGRN